MSKKRIVQLVVTVLIVLTASAGTVFAGSLASFQEAPNCCHDGVRHNVLSSRVHLDDHVFGYDGHGGVRHNVLSSRVYLDDHVFGYDELLDEMFFNGNNYVDIIASEVNGVIIVELWGEQVELWGEQTEQNGMSSAQSCSFGSHSGPFFNRRTVSFYLHQGGGSAVWTGLTCVRMTEHSGTCVSCNVLVRETFVMPFTCFTC